MPPARKRSHAAPFVPRLPDDLPLTAPVTPESDELREEQLWQDADLSYTEAEALDLRRIDGRSVDLTGSRLPRLSLTDVRLRASSLGNVRAHRASLERVHLDGCRLTGLDLAEARGQDLVLSGCQADLVNLRHSSLTRCAFVDTRLSSADLAGADLRGARFDGCDLRGAELSGARLQGATFVRCDLSGVGGLDALRGARMPRLQVLELAEALAVGLGIEVLDEDAGPGGV